MSPRNKPGAAAQPARATALRSPSDKASEHELIITRVFHAPRELVYKAWTDPRHAKQWWGPRDYPATYVGMDDRPGGRWRSCLTSTETGKELWQGGVIREIAPPERLVFTFAWAEEGERGLETLVTVTFADENGKTLMTFRQTPFQSVEERDGHRGGWSSAFDRLDEQLARALLDPVEGGAR
jgi:uncharacterized protein YndB with AHSA1/START domain